MPAVIPSDDVIWMKGFLYATQAGGTPDGVPFAALQEITLDDSVDLVNLEGSESLIPLATGIARRNVTGTARWAKVRGQQLVTLRGGDLDYDAIADETTWTMGRDDEPVLFDLHLMSPNDGSEARLELYGCIAPKLTIPMSPKNFVIPDFTFEVRGDGTNIGKVILPGDHTSDVPSGSTS